MPLVYRECAWRTSWRSRLPLVLLSALLSVPLAIAAPMHIRAEYAMLSNGQHVGDVTERYDRHGRAYQVNSVTRAVGIFALFAKGTIRLKSRGNIIRGGLQPLHFEYHRSNDATKAVFADFDWKRHRLTMKRNGKTETTTLPAGTQDRLSQMYQFMFLPRYNRALRFYMTNGRALTQYRYRYVGVEKISTPIGTLVTFRFNQHDPRDGENTDVWLAKAWHDFPVRVRIQGKRRNEEQLITHLQFH